VDPRDGMDHPSEEWSTAGDPAAAIDPPLARVSYLPGVTPPEPLTAATAAAAERAILEASGSTGNLTASWLASSSASDAFGADTSLGTPQGTANKAADRRANRAANVSMAALTRRGLSRWELEKTLTARELEPEHVASELDRLESVGLLDDAALADTLVRTQHERKGLGKGALVAELRRRHIDQEHIDAALEQLDDDSELIRARELANRRAPQLRSLDHATAARRLSGFLMRKGYPSAIVRTAVDEALDAGRGTVRFR
jgi:regulatory protein